MLSEPQIQRYARQLLLHDVGERGQEALGAVRVELALGGDGRPRGRRLSPGWWNRGRSPPRARRALGAHAAAPRVDASPPSSQVTAAPASPQRDGTAVLGSRAGAHVLWSVGDGTVARACLRDVDPGALGRRTRRRRPRCRWATLARAPRPAACARPGPRRSRGWRCLTTGAAHRARPAEHAPTTGRPGPRSWPSCSATSPPRCRTRDARCSSGRDDRLRLVPMENAQAAHHARDPEAFPRIAPDRVQPRPARLARAAPRPTEAAGERVLAIAHSHPDGGAQLLGRGSALGGPRRTAPASGRGAPRRGVPGGPASGARGGRCGAAVTSLELALSAPRAQPEQVRRLTRLHAGWRSAVRIVRNADFVYTQACAAPEVSVRWYEICPRHPRSDSWPPTKASRSG